MAVHMPSYTGVVNGEGADSNGNVLVVIVGVTWVQEQDKDELQVLLMPKKAIFFSRQIDKNLEFWGRVKGI